MVTFINTYDGTQNNSEQHTVNMVMSINTYDGAQNNFYLRIESSGEGQFCSALFEEG